MNAEKTTVRFRTENNALVRSVMLCAVHFLLGALVCRGMIFGTLAPFGGSYVAAVPRKKLFWATLGTAVGYIILKNTDAFRYVAVTVAISILRWILQDYKPLSRSALFAPAAAFLPIFGSGVVMTFVSTSTLTELSVVTVEALVAAAVAYFMQRSLFLFNSGRRLGSFTQSETAAIVMSGCVLILSLGSISVEGVSLGRILAVIVILIFARYGSVGGGAVAGIATGAVFGMSNNGFAFICAGFGFGGLVGGLFSATGKLGVAISFTVCDFVMLLSVSDRSMILPLTVEAIIAAAAFMLLPGALERYVAPLFSNREGSLAEQSMRNSVLMRLDFAANALGGVSGCVNSVSRQLSKLYAPSADKIYETAVEDVCGSCGLRAFCWERQKAVTKQDFERLSAPLKAQGFVTEQDVESLFSKKCCRGLEVADSINRSYRDYLGGIEAANRVTQIRGVVAGQFSGIAEILGDLATEIENARYYDADASARVLEYLQGEGYVPMECGCMIDTGGRMSVEIELANGRRQLRRAVLAKEISKLCGRCFDTPVITEIGTRRRIVLNEVPAFDVEVGVFQHIFGNGKLCGDCVNCFSSGFGDFVALISDGMGTGGRAAVDSNMTVSIMTKLLKAGLSEDSALKVVNSALMVKSEDESLATVDLARVDLFTGRVTFNKAGAPFSYVKKNGSLLRKNAPSLPVGILGDISFSEESVKLSGGDLIVMISDGAICNDDKWLEELIRKFSDEKCSDLAKAVVNETLNRRNDGHDDDITAVVIRLADNNS